jgi:hypothetical protein
MMIKILSYDDPFCHDPDCRICGASRDAIGKIFEVDDELCDGPEIFAIHYNGYDLYFLKEEVEICQ